MTLAASILTAFPGTAAKSFRSRRWARSGGQQQRARPLHLSCKAVATPAKSVQTTKKTRPFRELAKQLTGSLVVELAGDSEAFSRLQAWLQGETFPVDFDNGSYSQAESDSSDSEYDPVLFIDSSSLAATAASCLGVKSISGILTLDTSVAAWLGCPSDFEERSDVQMVAAIAYRLLQSLEEQTGESFDGREEQYAWMAAQTEAVLGSALSRREIHELVTAFLSAPRGTIASMWAA